MDTKYRSVPAPRILSVATAVPENSYTQQEILDLFEVDDLRTRSLFLNGGIERRNLTLPPLGPDGRPVAESQGDLLRKHVRSGVAMGGQAVLRCVEQLGAEPADVSHLCCVSSTGFITPGFSAMLIKELGLPADCSRLDVVGMGCNAGLNGLSAVAGWTALHPGQLAVMVCIEVCSAAYAFDGTVRTAVVNSLFGDGAAAVAVAGGENGDGPALLGFTSQVVTDAIDAMRYDWDDSQHRFSFYLDPEIPYVVGAHAEKSLWNLLSEAGLRSSDISHWVLHSGGRKVIDSVRINLGLSRHDTRHTTGVLRDHGNLSSGAFLFAYERLLREGCTSPGDRAVLMTMGPGTTIEMALLGW